MDEAPVYGALQTLRSPAFTTFDWRGAANLINRDECIGDTLNS